jgi:hypothetical protein
LLIQKFPNLQNESFKPVSEDSDEYNCIAWAADVVDDRWWPDPDPANAFWPIAWRDPNDKDCFIGAFKSYGNYEPCDKDFSLEAGYEKVVLYVDSNDDPKHMARQLANGKWTSKCGVYGWDIIHETVKGVEGQEYGQAILALRRERTDCE